MSNQEELFSPIPTEIHIPDDTGPGKILREARQKVKLTEADIAERLCITATRVLAIENDDYSNMPGHTFIRGYIRAYANVVKLPGDDLIAAFNRLNIKEPDTDRPSSTFYQQQPNVKDKTMQWVTYGIAAGMFFLVIAWWQSHKKESHEQLIPIEMQLESRAQLPQLVEKD